MGHAHGRLPPRHPALFGISFSESSFFPLPPDVMLIPMVLANPKKAYTYAAVCTVASVLGGLLGYALGSVFYETIGQKIIHFYHLEQQAENFRLLYGNRRRNHPSQRPHTHSLQTRHHRFRPRRLSAAAVRHPLHHHPRRPLLLIAGVLKWKGETARIFIEKHLERLTLAFLAIIILGFVAFFYLA